MNTLEQMKLFMEPRTIALVGVPRFTGESSFNILENLLRHGFSGKIYPVNPAADQILGVKVYPSLRDIPDEIDLAVIVTPRDTGPGVVRECTAKGIRAIIVEAQGFADANDEGKYLQAQMVRTAREGGARIIGPNTLGVVNAFLNFSTAFGWFKTGKSPIGAISQTGLFFLGTSRFRFGKIIDLGNTCDIDHADALEYFEDDPDTKVVVLHVEGIPRGKRFIEVASRVARKKPILALKSGRGEAGARASQSHTGSLVGRDEVYDALFKQCGVIRANDEEELEDLALTLSRLPRMRGRRVAIMTWAGSAGVFSVDACEKWGLEIPELSPHTISSIRQISPPSWLPVADPVDMAGVVMLSSFELRSFNEKIRIILDALLAEERADAVLVVIPDYLDIDLKGWDISLLIPEAAAAFEQRPVAFCILGPQQKELSMRIEKTGKTVLFPTCERAVRALARLREYTERCNA